MLCKFATIQSSYYNLSATVRAAAEVYGLGLRSREV
jgi:hypothetical protein